MWRGDAATNAQSVGRAAQPQFTLWRGAIQPRNSSAGTVRPHVSLEVRSGDTRTHTHTHTHTHAHTHTIWSSVVDIENNVITSSAYTVAPTGA